MYILIKEYLKDKKFSLVFIFMMQLVAAVFSMVMPYVNGKFIDILTVSTTMQDILNFIIFLAILTLSSIVLSYIVNVVITKVKTNISYELTLDIWKHLSRVPLEKIQSYDHTYLNQRVKGDCDNIINFWISNIFSILVNLISVIAILLILLRANMTLFIIATLFIPIYCFVYLKMKRPLYDRGKQTLESGNVYFGSLNSMYMRIKEIKTAVSYDYEENKIKSIFDHYFTDLILYTKLSYLFNASDGLISWAFQSIVFLVGGAYVISGRMSIGQFTMMNAYFNMILTQVKYYFELGQSYQSVLVSDDRVLELYNIDKEKQGEQDLAEISEIQLKNINYIYNEERACSKNVQYYINKPGVYAIVGKNGTGKTTLINTIIGVNNLGMEGTIEFNGYNIENLNMYNLRKHNVSIMLQNQRLPDITVKEYINMYASEEAFNSWIDTIPNMELFSCKMFDIYPLLEKKLDTLSTGQRQMVILFATFIKPADIYILDEPTSNIYVNLVDKVIEFLNELKKEKIILIISHDKKFIPLFDDVYSFD